MWSSLHGPLKLLFPECDDPFPSVNWRQFSLFYLLVILIVIAGGVSTGHLALRVNGQVSMDLILVPRQGDRILHPWMDFSTLCSPTAISITRQNPDSLPAPRPTKARMGGYLLHNVCPKLYPSCPVFFVVKKVFFLFVFSPIALELAWQGAGWE
jgi:hypothetical protein